MHPFPGLRRIGRARRGVVGVVFAVMTMTLFASAGIAVDSARIMFVRERLISACDAAALAGGKVLNSGTNVTVGTGATASPVPQWQYDAWRYFGMNFPTGYYGVTASQTNPTVTRSTDGTQLTVQQSVTLPLVFGTFLGHPDPLQISATSVAYAGKVDVAMVLDNTGSMAATVPGDNVSKISVLRTAAAAFVDSLTSLGNNNVRISIVPFTMTVNVGVSYAGSSWLDPKASYMYAAAGYTPPLNAATTPPSAFKDVFEDRSGNPHEMDRIQLFNSLKAGGKTAGWAGCVEMRPAIYDSTNTTTHYDTEDLPATAGVPASLFVPYFVPSEPDVGSAKFYNLVSGSSGTYLPYTNNYLKDYSTDDTLTTANASEIQQGDYLKYTSPTMNVSTWQQSQSSSPQGPPNILGYAVGPNAGCQGFDQTSTDNNGANTGSFITLQPLMRLTTSTTSLETEIAGMLPMGNTYLPVGLFWGWETISPNSVFPDNQVAYTNTDVTKVVILLTDGCNEIMNVNNWSSFTSYPNACSNFSTAPSTMPNWDQSLFQAEGYTWQNRLGTASASETDRATAADTTLQTMCNNMKADNIVIYTIGVGLANTYSPALPACATGGVNGGKFAAISSPSTQLDTTFQQIAHDLTTVRLISAQDATP